jgi:hypothetical protein
MDELIQELERRLQADPSDMDALRRFIAELIRRGDLLRALVLLLANWARMGFASLEEALRAFPGMQRLFELYEELARLLGLKELGGAGGWEKARIRVLLKQIGRLVKFVPSAATLETIGAIGLPLLATALIWIGGLSLVASKLGTLGTRDPFTDLSEEPYEAILDAFMQHSRSRDDYRVVPTSAKLRNLAYEASYLLGLITSFLRRYPDDPRASYVRDVLRPIVQDYVTKYYYGEGPTSLVRPPTPKIPVTTPLPVPQSPPEHPHTVSPPATFEEELRLQYVKSEADSIRKQIKTVRAQIRKRKKELREAEPWRDETRKNLKEAIERSQQELEKLREKAQDLDVETDEELDEPLDPVGPAPLPPWPLGHDWSHPSRLYVDPKTGRQIWGGSKSPGEEWEPMDDPATGKPRYRWGWVPRIDPETLEPRWEPGWVPMDRLETSYLPLRSEPVFSLAVFSEEMKKAQRRGIDIFKIAQKHGINLFRPALQVEFDKSPARFTAVLNEALEEQAAQRGTTGWGNFLKSATKDKNLPKPAPQG